MLLERRLALFAIQPAIAISVEALQQLGAASLSLSAMSRRLSIELGAFQLAVAVRVEPTQLLGTTEIPSLLAKLPLLETQVVALLTADLTVAITVESLAELLARRPKAAFAKETAPTANATPASTARAKPLATWKAAPTSA